MRAQNKKPSNFFLYYKTDSWYNMKEYLESVMMRKDSRTVVFLKNHDEYSIFYRSQTV